MEQEKMAQFIAQRRKDLGLTQRALAQQLHVTDKAVSKWERGLSCPDILLVPELARALGVSTAQLLDGGAAGACRPAAVPGREEAADGREEAVAATLAWAGEAQQYKFRLAHRIAFLGVTALVMIAAAVCTICDLAIGGGLTWSLYPLASLALGWAVAAPVVARGGKGVPAALLALTALLAPYLAALDWLAGAGGRVVRIGVPCAGVGVAFLWAVWALCVKVQWSWYRRAAALLVLGMGVDALIDLLLAWLLPQPYPGGWDFFEYGLCLLCAAGVLALERTLQKKDRTPQTKDREEK